MVYLRKFGSRKRKKILSRIRDSVSSPSVSGTSYDDALLSTGDARSPLAREYFVTILPNSKKRLSSIQDLRSPYSGSKIPRIHSGNADPEVVCGELYVGSPCSPKRLSIQDLRSSSACKVPRMQENQNNIVTINKEHDCSEVRFRKNFFLSLSLYLYYQLFLLL